MVAQLDATYTDLKWLTNTEIFIDRKKKNRISKNSDEFEKSRLIGGTDLITPSGRTD